MKTLSLPHKHGLKITFIYFVIAGCWIYFSDRILAGVIDSPAVLAQMQTYKGLFFVLVTSGLLYYLINQNTSSIIKSRDRLEELLKEKQVVLAELHHRVKNNLAIITGLIELQSEQLEESSKQVLQETQFRIYTLANIEELLYQKGDMANIPFHEFMEDFISSLEEPYDKESFIQTEINEVNLNINQAVPLALMVNEIFSQFRINGPLKEVGGIQIALRYYLPDKVSLVLTFKQTPQKIVTRLVDGRNIEAILIDLYTKQLMANSKWRPSKKGGTFRLEFEKSDKPGSSSRMARVG